MKAVILTLALCSGTCLAGTLLEFGAGEPPWYARNDTVMGGVSSSRVRVQDGVLTFTGQVRLENGGGFSGIRSAVGRFDLGGFTTVKLRVRGDGKRYALQLGTSTVNGVTYRGEFGTVAGQWTEVTLPPGSPAGDALGRAGRGAGARPGPGGLFRADDRQQPCRTVHARGGLDPGAVTKTLMTTKNIYIAFTPTPQHLPILSGSTLPAWPPPRCFLSVTPGSSPGSSDMPISRR